MPEDDGALRVEVAVGSALSRLAVEDGFGVEVKHRSADRPSAPALSPEHRDADFESRVGAPFVLKVSVVRPEQRAAIAAVTEGSGRSWAGPRTTHALGARAGILGGSVRGTTPGARR